MTETAPKADPFEARIIPRLIESEMKKSYLDYAMSVIVGRALPDVRDGLKPVHRRILYAMHDNSMRWNQPYKKCARIVGEVLGKYHPHGDLSVYDALVRMAQEFSLRYMLIDGQGNFGSVDGDAPAAMRYTEARMAKLADEMLQDIEKETVDFVENFDGSLKEPSVLPSKFPNLLVNGSSGIAVGMATNIPPHSLSEVAAAEIELIDNPDADVTDLMRHLPGPDFPTGGIIAGRSGILSAYKHGRGKIRVKAVVEQEEYKGRDRFIVTEIPYMVNKAMLVEQIAECVKNKTIEGISDLRDESDRTGMRVVIELKKDASPDVVLNGLWKHTRLQVTFGMNMIALVNNEPKCMGLIDLLQHHITHRQLVVRKRTAYDLMKAEERAHILEGLKIALDNIDEAVELIKKAANAAEAKEALMGAYDLDEVQSQAILDMKLQKLTGLEQEKLLAELKDLREKITRYKEILADENEILKIIKEELRELQEKFGDKRRTEIIDVEDEDIDMEDLIEQEEMVVTVSNQGYVKRMPLDLYRAQNRGGIGVRGATTKEDDFIEHLFVANTHDYLLIFTNKGQVYWKKVYTIPEGSRQAKGRPIINLIPVEKDEFVRAVIKTKEFSKDEYLLFATADGTVKKTALEAYSRPRANGIIAIKLNPGNDLVNVLKVKDGDQLLIASKNGQAVKFLESDVRDMGRNSAGVRGIKLKSGDQVIGAIKAHDEKQVFTITENGYGKRSSIEDYRLINRGGSGVKNIICSPRNGKVVAIKSVDGSEDLMFASRNGTVIRTGSSQVSVIGRNTQGVRVMSLRGDDKVVACAKIVAEDSEEESDE